MFFEHGGRQSAGGGAASFLYPFLDDKATDVDALLADVARSVVMKADEIGALREQTLTEGAETLRAAAEELRARLDAGGTLLALGNGGSATDAMDVVADFRAAGRRALDLTEDPAIITALANDIGTDAIFSRQVIAYGGPGDALIALSTSGNSAQRDRRAGRGAQARADDDRVRRLRRRAGGGGRARRPRRRSPAPSTSRGSRRRRRARTTCSASSWDEARPRAGSRGRCRGWASGPFVYRLASELDLAGFVLNDERGVLRRGRGRGRRGRRLPPPARPRRRRRWRRSRRCGRATSRPRASAASASSPARTAASRSALVSPDTATCDDCLRELFDPADRRYRYPFVNCTNCGPRFTIVRGVPYDRPLTTMAGFEMCPRCAAEYEDPADRRFHAQPNACPECGPTLRRCRRPPRRRGAARGGGGAARGRGRRGQGHRRLPPRLPGGARAGGRGAAGAQAPRGQAVRGDGARRRGGARARLADRRGGRAAGRARPPDRARAAPAGRAGRRLGRAALAPTSASCCPTRRCTTCCWPTPASRS